MYSMQKILLIVASEGYQPIEYGTPKRLLVQAGYEVHTASIVVGLAHASDGSTTQADIAIHDIVPHSYDGIFLIG